MTRHQHKKNITETFQNIGPIMTGVFYSSKRIQKIFTNTYTNYNKEKFNKPFKRQLR